MYLALFCALMSLSFAAPVLAQQVPGALVPGRQEPIKPPVAKSAPGKIVPKIRSPEAPPIAAEITFVLMEIKLEGATALTRGQLKKIWQPYLEKEISVATLYEIAGAITARYVDAGYALSFAVVPEQEIDQGVVTLRVIEGFVEWVAFTGDMAAGKDKIDSIPIELGDMAQKIVLSRPLKTTDIERYMLLINDIPGMTAKATFAASKTTHAASSLIIDVQHDKTEMGMSVNNHLTSTLRYGSAQLQAALNSAITGVDQIQGSFSCGRDCGIYQAASLSWSTYVGSEGLQLDFGVAQSFQDPQRGVLAPLDFEGNNLSFNFEARYPWLRSRQKNLNLGFSAKVDNSKTSLFIGTLTKDRVRTASVYSAYDYLSDDGALTLLRGDLTQGLDVLGATQDDDPQKSRAEGSATFTTASFDIARTQPLAALSPKLQNYSLQIMGRGHMALNDPLLSASECFYGGTRMGRGFDSGALSGEHCLTGSLELRRDMRFGNTGLQPYGFIDGGLVWQKGAIAPGTDRSTGAQSAGVGLRAAHGSALSGDVQIGWPIRETFTDNNKSTPRVLFTMGVKY